MEKKIKRRKKYSGLQSFTCLMPKELFRELKEISLEKTLSMSVIVEKAITEKLKKMRAEERETLYKYKYEGYITELTSWLDLALGFELNKKYPRILLSITDIINILKENYPTIVNIGKNNLREIFRDLYPLLPHIVYYHSRPSNRRISGFSLDDYKMKQIEIYKKSESGPLSTKDPNPEKKDLQFAESTLKEATKNDEKEDI